nr:MAG TPA: hypothetical protein [Caudoviricetes sp.]
MCFRDDFELLKQRTVHAQRIRIRLWHGTTSFLNLISKSYQIARRGASTQKDIKKILTARRESDII